MEPFELVTDQVVLRVPDEHDIDSLVQHCSDPAIIAFTTVPVPYDRAYAAHYVKTLVPERWAGGRKLVWGVRHVDSSEGLLGIINLFDIELGRGTAEIGYWLAAEGRGRGIMTQAVTAVLDHAFLPTASGGLGLFRVQWTAAPENIGSRRVAERVGFRFEGRLRGALLLRGQRSDALRAGLLATDDRVPQRWITSSAD
ncbi:GNAT family protein [Curtobacterium sp. BRB10]|uniref:GNAT family N-acetyltransferase n=1 Tax=Curtobacterium sp. BRB10 TaxID=2962579 RepID=UPI002881B0F3|nr:GNAT family protein [Curtobacterium sp. BRB10]MDT0232584.1 GNAT family protein [Curtobacterium sp. BRB10]